MDEIIRAAAELGKRIAEDQRIKAYVAARRAVEADEAAERIMADHAAQIKKIRDLEAAVKPVEVADKRRLEELNVELMSNEKLKELLKSETDYAQLMHHVHQAIERPLLDALEEPRAEPQ